MALTILVVLACALTFTGTWFTDSKDIKGILQDPIINVDIIDEAGTEVEDYFYTSSTDSKPVYIKFTNTNVKYQLVRVLVNVEWGTLDEENNFNRDDSIINGLDALTPNYANASSWIKGENVSTTTQVAQIMGKTVAELKEWVERDGETTIDDLATTLGLSTATYYYYNDIVDISSLTNSTLKVLNGFTFNGGSNSIYAGKTAQVKITVETASVSDKTIGTSGMWTSSDTHIASSTWVSTINAKRQTLNI